MYSPSFFKCMGCVCLMLLFTNCKKKTDDPQPASPQISVKDIDGNVYGIVRIGGQDWMTADLKVTHYRDGSSVAMNLSDTEWGSATIGAGAYYDKDMANKAYGINYNYYAVTDSRGLAPAGWHVATDADWAKLLDALGGMSIAGAKIKSEVSGYWETPILISGDYTGFEAIPGGYRFLDGSFGGIHETASWWTSTASDENNGWYYDLNNQVKVNRGTFDKRGGSTARCVRD